MIKHSGNLVAFAALLMA